jgi:hypothetical protein
MELPAGERARLEKQRGLVQTAIDAVNEAIKKFNVRCAAIASAALLASCQGEMAELQAATADLEKLKVQFNTDVGQTTERYPAPKPLPPAPREQVATANSEVAAPRKKTGAPGRSSALKELKSAKISGDKAKASEDGRDPAMDVFDRPGVAVDGDDAVRIGERKPLVVPEAVRKDPKFQKLETQRKKLEQEHAALERDLAAAKAAREKSVDKGRADVEVARIKQKLSDNESNAHAIRVKEKELIDLSLKLQTKSEKPVRKEPPSPLKNNRK